MKVINGRAFPYSSSFKNLEIRTKQYLVPLEDVLNWEEREVEERVGEGRLVGHALT